MNEAVYPYQPEQMSSHSQRSVPCPAAEFGLEPCDEQITEKGTTYYGGYWDPPEFDVSDPEGRCDCYKKVPDEQAYWDRVSILLEAAEWDADDEYYGPDPDGLL